MKETTLVVMAAGIGSRYGKGIKQLEAVGPSGEAIMEYSICDALEAGFTQVVFIIRRDIEQDFKTLIGDKIARKAKVSYAYQERTNLPGGFTCPDGRTKPWGTGQAVLSAKSFLHGPFLVINADDYYGKKAYQITHDYLTGGVHSQGDQLDICMAGFVLGNTLSDNGGVTRGVCATDAEGFLTGLQETKNVIRTPEGAGVQKDGQVTPIDAAGIVSMNMWGLTPAFLQVLEEGFVHFLEQLAPGDLTAEYLLPNVIDRLIQSGQARVRVLPTPDVWFGVTYHEDKDTVTKAFQELVSRGEYQSPLF